MGNLQAVCDHKRRFIYLDICSPASTSDFLAFSVSSLYEKLERGGLLAEGLCIFGDAAYANSQYMCVPFKGVSDGPKDGFNYYHSRLRMTIECAFGMLVHRWGVLRKPIPVNISIERTAQLTRALCILHNFCINNKETVVEQPTAKDLFHIETESGNLGIRNKPKSREYLTSGHSDDVHRNSMVREPSSFPRNELLSALIEQNLVKRPHPKGSTSTSN